MVSFSTPQGTVGAHLDQYDVFIIQGQGKRRWQVGLPLSPEQARHFCHGDSFEVLIDVEMEPGDALYIPPNCPHQTSHAFGSASRTIAVIAVRLIAFTGNC